MSYTDYEDYEDAESYAKTEFRCRDLEEFFDLFGELDIDEWSDLLKTQTYKAVMDGIYYDSYSETRRRRSSWIYSDRKIGP